MTTQKSFPVLSDAMYNYRFVTITLTNSQSARGWITHISDTGFVIGTPPTKRNRINFDRVESVKIY
ncbi:MAG: hypothetical protein OEL83_06055 [Desulforhopalus sp.]|nr:hypothetical protein [Desulforhopalus sp.]